MNGSKKMYLSQMLVIAFGLLVCISTVMPAATVLGQKVNLLKPDGELGSGIFFIVLSALAIIFALLKKKIPTLIFAVLNLLLGIIQFSQFSDYMEFASAGLYLMLIGTIAMLASTIFMMIQVPKK